LTGRAEPLILLSAGEASGDLHGATLCRALQEMRPGVRLRGMGGARMAAAGLEVVADVSSHAVVGTTEAVGRVPALLRAYRVLREELAAPEPPHALVVIDFPEFNLWLARAARRAGVPVIYFIPPQLWAWRSGRIRQIARRIARVLAVLPFEHDLYRQAGVPVEFVGHPLLDVVPLDLAREEARRRLAIDPGDVLIGLLPGSRREEVQRLLPPLLVAARRLAAAGMAPRFALALAPTVDAGAVSAMVKAAVTDGGPRVDVLEQRTYEIMAAADVLLVSSGTATLEAALLGTPMVVCYRVSRFTQLVVRLIAQVRWCSLPNLIAGRVVVPEILQDELTGQRLASEALRLLEDPVAMTAQRAAFKEVRAQLGEPGVSRRAARAVLETAGLRVSRAG
jgi:lipid-A-disaccharide synthase